MRPELELIEKIEQYLRNELPGNERAAFEKQLAIDPALKAEVELQQDIMRGVERADLKQRIFKAKRGYKQGKNFTKWGLGGLSAVVVVAAFLFYKSGENRNEYGKNSLPEYNEQGEIFFADADKNIPAQIFRIDVSKDTVIETKGGIVMAIPAHGFLDENGNPVEGRVNLAVKEALDPSTMMDAGLSTKSGDKLLETGGMFFIDARKDGKIIKINPANSIHAEIPANEFKGGGMQLFSGKRMADGTIDWVDPKPLEHDLVPVDIKTLNFYPPDYLDSLRHWGYDVKKKKFTDSLYYSFAYRFSQLPKMDTSVVAYESEVQSDSGTRMAPADGRTLFMSKCASCHHPLKDATGPKLGGILNNDFYKGDIKKLSKWIYNVNSMIQNEPHYRELKERFGSSMSQFDGSNLSEKDIAAIFDYIEQTYATGNADDYYPPPSTCGINPAKIKAIWNDRFNNTIISTREFEERLRVIHETSDPAILDLYLNNLDKPLFYIDSLAALKWGALDATNMFSVFASKHDGKVKTGTVQFELLRKYYENKTRAYTEAIAKTVNEFWNKQAELDVEAENKTSEHEEDSVNRIAENFAQEFEVNVKEAYRQLGYDTSIRRVTGTVSSVYSAQIVTTGWYNVDKYVYESTAKRTTLDYTDPQTGKKAVIKYDPVTIRVNQWNEYDRLYVYLLPDKLNSFMRVSGAEGMYSEKLDELMKYNMVCIGYKDEQAYFYSQKSIGAKYYPGIDLRLISKDEMKRKLDNFSTGIQSRDIEKENDFFRFEIIDAKRQKQNMALQELTYKIGKVIFSCSNWPADSTKALVAVPQQ